MRFSSTLGRSQMNMRQYNTNNANGFKPDSIFSDIKVEDID